MSNAIRTKAVDWLRRAAEQGDVGGQRNLALCYYEGWGVPQDQDEAARWYEKAAEQGDADAQDMLSWMKLVGGGCPQDYPRRAAVGREGRRAGPRRRHGAAGRHPSQRARRRARSGAGGRVVASARPGSATPRRRRCWVRPISPAKAWRAIRCEALHWLEHAEAGGAGELAAGFLGEARPCQAAQRAEAARRAEEPLP